MIFYVFFFFSSRRRHTRFDCDWSSDVCSSDLKGELERIGYVGSQEPGDHPIGAYFESHIEQGPVLEDNARTIGVVTGVLGIRWYDCVVTEIGRASCRERV